MTADVRDRILGLLSSGPATVARLSAGLGVPGGVVSYELKLLERDGLVRVGATRPEQGVATPVYVSTAAAAAPPLRVPAPLPGLAWIGDEPYPTPLWTVPQPLPAPTGPDPAVGGAATGNAAPAWDVPPAGDAGAPGDRPSAGDDTPAGAEPGEPEIEQAGGTGGATVVAYTGIRFPTRAGRAPAGRSAPGETTDDDPAHDGDTADDDYRGGDTSRARRERRADANRGQPPRPMSERQASGWTPLPQSRRFDRADPESRRGPRLHDMRRVPMDEATFYEFASRLEALAREFAARATPGQAAAELTVLLTRPDGDATSGYGYGS
jgi:hypothetical protein